MDYDVNCRMNFGVTFDIQFYIPCIILFYNSII